MGYSNYLYKGIRVVLIFLVVLLWAFSIHFFVENYIEIFIKKESGRSEEEWGLSMIECYYEVTLMLLLVNHGRQETFEVLEYVNSIFFLCFGVAIQLFVYGKVVFLGLN